MKPSPSMGEGWVGVVPGMRKMLKLAPSRLPCTGGAEAGADARPTFRLQIIRVSRETRLEDPAEERGAFRHSRNRDG
jgi:hypothetical protein